MSGTEEQIESQPKAGAILKRLRDKKDLSIQEVASQMRLDPRIIQALENDDYKSFPADTYIRGYLRNYAKLLGIDGGEIIAVYESEAPEPPEIIPDVKHSTQVSSSDKPVKAFTYLITFILVLLLFIWWYQGNLVFNRGIRLTPVPDNTTRVTQPPVTEQSKPVKDQPQEIPQPDPSLSNEEIQPQAPESEQPVEPTTAAPAAENPDLTVTETSASAEPAVSTTIDQTDDSINKAMPGPDTLYFKLNADCWIEVHDRFNKEVYVNLARTGDEIYLNGSAPFQVKLGNAQVVILEFNHRPFDPAPYTSRGIARFTLGN